MTCTWENCQQEATHPQIGADGSTWANLCDDHHKMLDDVIGVSVPKMLGYWVRAQGGAKAAARRMTHAL